MPELPEVETIRSQLTQFLPLKILEQTNSPHLTRLLAKKKGLAPSTDFNVQGATLQACTRVGKYLRFHFANRSEELLSHLGMSGSWQISIEPLQMAHTHLQWRVCHLATAKELTLAYIDPRRFGALSWAPSPLIDHYLHTGLGPDVLQNPPTTEQLWNICQQRRSRNQKIKTLLLDQRAFAGIGNYLAAEILAYAALHPLRLAASLTITEIDTLKNAIAHVLACNIRARGLTFQGGYHDLFGARGEGLAKLMVFHQERCGLCRQRSIKKIFFDGRTTYYCEHCQSLPTQKQKDIKR